jgi:hypothetical protein
MNDTLRTQEIKNRFSEQENKTNNNIINEKLNNILDKFLI